MSNSAVASRISVADVLLNEVTAYFQPIVAADTGRTYAYEVLGRYIDKGNVKSVGAFFSTATNEEALEIDQIIRRCALKRFAEEGNGEYLFLNLRLSWIMRYSDNPQEQPTIKWAKEFGIDLNKLVFEITEEEFMYENVSFINVIDYYKSIGCRIAIDDFGSAASQIDRLALISPDILKIDKKIVQQSEVSLHYREYLKSLTSFAEQVGVEVLYEGIETEKQLDICVTSGGRFYQGFLIAKPQSSILNSVINQGVLLTSIIKHNNTLKAKLGNINNKRKLWDARIEEFLQNYEMGFCEKEVNEWLLKIGQPLSSLIKRLYLCDRLGNQLSYNIEMEDGKIALRDYRNKNWAWRGFFQNAINSLEKGAKSYMSNMYRDVTTKEQIQTYTCRINPEIYLFIDITK